ncbi:S-layer homology domain-containing protein [Paenibacillus woosongensis]|nr:S-layer homology domain-containing protein [Paenibacillus woosongensis]
MKQSYKSNMGNGLVKLCITLLLIQSFLITVPYDNVSAQGSFHPALSDRWGGIQQIAGGRYHSLALTADGEVLAWGLNQGGTTTVPVEAQSSIVSISAGQDHSLALTSGGEVIAWGRGRFGEANVPAEAKSDIVAIAAGNTAFHSLALTSSGKVIAWGSNSYGQSDVPEEAESGVVAIAAGYWHSLALTAAGEVIAWGDGREGKLDVPDEVQGQAVAISAGSDHSLALTASGKVIAWGSNDYGQSSVPKEAESGVIAIAAGEKHSLALKSDGSVIAWGISDGSWEDNEQTVVPETAKSGVIAIAAGYRHSLALKADGMIIAWGDNDDGQTDVPEHVHERVKAKQLAAGKNHSLALTSDGQVLGWGSDLYNRLSIPADLQDVRAIEAGEDFCLALKADGTIVIWGDGSHYAAIPPEVQGQTVAISVGSYHALALQADGTVVAWGRIEGGENDKRLDVPDDLDQVIAVSAGLFHSLALKADGTVVIWGANQWNQLDMPSGLHDVKAISAGHYHSLALKTDGTVVAWGDNTYKQLEVPENLQDVVAISAGRHHSVALKSDGTVVAWGNNTFNQLEVPSNLREVVAISAGTPLTLALQADGAIVGWGDNVSDQLNIPTSDLETIELTDQSGRELELLFDTVQQEYTVLIDNHVTLVNVLATLENAEFAAVYVNGERQSDPAKGVNIPVTDEQTVVTVEVVPYLQESKTYTITLSQEAEPEQVSKPVASPAGGAVPAGTTVTLSTYTNDATIYYTMDGSTPTSSSAEYTAPIEVTGGMTLKAIAVKEGMLDSEVLEEYYTIATIPAPANLTASAADRSVTLKWEAVTGTGSVTYAVYQAEGTSAPVDPANWKLIQSNVSANSYIVTGLTNGTTYAFVVKAITVKGASDFSNVAIATPRAPGGNSGSGGGGGGRVLSNNADLADLQVWVEGKLLKLSPSFASGTTEYTARTEAERIEIVVKEAHSAAKVVWKDKVITDSIQVDLEEGDNTIELTVQAENGTKKTYTLTIYREMPKPNEPVIALTDIAGHWAEDYIMRAVEKGFVSGYPDGTFKPNHPVTRAEFTVMLAGALKLEGDGSALIFTDHDRIGGWAKQAVAQAVQAGIVVGYNDGSFRPNTQITRAEMAVMIARALQLELNANALPGFADDEAIPQWAKGAVEAIRKLGIVDGRGGNRFVPNETATRAEATVMLLRLLDR